MSITMATQNPWIPDEHTFGARLALLRRQMRWNVAEASTECGLPLNSWRRYEGGNRPRDLVDVVSKISSRTGVDRMWLMFGERPDPDSNREPTDYKAVVPRPKRSLTRPPARPDARRPHRSAH